MKHLTKDVVNLIADLCTPITIARWSATSKKYYAFLSIHSLLVRWRKMFKRKSIRYCAEQAAQKGYGDLVMFLLTKENGYGLMASVLSYACLGGHFELVEELLLNYPIYESSLDMFTIAYAARGGHYELVNWLLLKVTAKAQLTKYNWNYLLQAAAKGGSLQLVNFFLQRGATNFEAALWGALEGGHMQLVKFFIEKGAIDYYSHGLAFAMYGGHRAAVDFMLNVQNVNNIDWNAALSSACLAGHRDLVDLCIQKGHGFLEGTFADTCIEQAAAGGHKELVKFFIQMGAKNLHWALCSAQARGHLDVVKILSKAQQEDSDQ